MEEPQDEPADDKPSEAPAVKTLGYVENITKNSLLTLNSENAFWDFDDHAAVGVGLDGTILDYEMYYGVRLSADGEAQTVSYSWYNYTDNGAAPVSFRVIRIYDGKTNEVKAPGTMGESKTLVTNKNIQNGPYKLAVTWSDGVVTDIYFYRNGEAEMYTCKQTDNARRASLYITHRKGLDKLIADAGLTPEDSLGYSDKDWAYPVTDWKNKYRCDNDLWIGLADKLIPDKSVPDTQKAVVIHDWMTENLAYDRYKTTVLHNVTRMKAYGDYTGKWHMWTTHAGVCADFSTVYAIMLRSVGVPVSSIENPHVHVWNLVYLDGEWVEIDLTTDIRRTVRGEDVHDVTNADETVCYKSLTAPEANSVKKCTIGTGTYTYEFVTGKQR